MMLSIALYCAKITLDNVNISTLSANHADCTPPSHAASVLMRGRDKEPPTTCFQSRQATGQPPTEKFAARLAIPILTILAIVHHAGIRRDPPGYNLKVLQAPTPHPAKSFGFRLLRRRQHSL